MIERTMYLERMRPFYDSQFVKVITGVRRCGKSVLLEQVVDDLIGRGVPSDDITYVSLEDYANRSLLSPDALDSYLSGRISGRGMAYVLLDEVQLVPGFEAVVNSLQSKRNVSVFITGSNSRILSGELASLLGGRTLSFQVMPFTFAEYRRFMIECHADAVPDDRSLLQTYLTWGGMPLACAEPTDETRAVVLDNLYSSIVLRDIIMRNSIKSPVTLECVLDYLIGNSSLTVSGNTVAAALTDNNRKVSSPTVYDYIQAITDSYIVSKVRRYDIQGKKALAFEKKVYACDLGFFHLRKSRVKDELGHIVETAVYNELVARGYKVYVGKTHRGEIDFIVEGDKGRCYVQAAYLLSNDDVIEREFGAYDAVKDSYPKYVVSMDPITLSRDGVRHLTLIDFLLHDDLSLS
ncbi:MAG: ATP-binding protein [Atopobiaceae bacterium]|jgi:predicted AAA+ superfamily ATPase|nr:ATP-binding protein [Atopobiaceae bacterium]MDD2588203.1 ATP-binding protein [Atopobiaceae bacterium]